MTKLLPIIMIALSTGAAGAYAFAGDWRQAVYWAAAAALNSAVTL